jgi:hypothetical protein
VEASFLGASWALTRSPETQNTQTTTPKKIRKGDLIFLISPATPNALARIIHEIEIVQAVWSETGCPGTACAKQWHTFMNNNPARRLSSR